MKQCIYIIMCAIALSSCSVYKTYERPLDITTEGLYQQTDSVANADTTSLGDLHWRDLFKDEKLQVLIERGLTNNADMQTALLRIDEAQAQLKSAKLAFLPSLTFSPNSTVSSTDGEKAVKTYELPLQVSWEVDLFGNLRNAKKNAQATLLEQEAYRQAVSSELVATIAIDYYTLLMLDEQIKISTATMEVWKEQVRTIEARLAVGEETENALTQARANLHGLEATHNDLLRQLHEAENTLCTLLGETSHSIERGTLDNQTMPEQINTGISLRLLSKRPDVVQAEGTLMSAYYTTLQAKSAFYPSLTLTGSGGWTNSLGQAVTNPGGWIASAVASLSQPIFNRGKLRANLRVSKDEEEIAKIDFRQTILKAGQEVNDALYAVQSAGRSLAHHQNQCLDLERTITTSEDLYRTGNATYLEVLSARQSLLTAQLDVVTDRFTELQSVVNLYKALGGGQN